MKVEYEFSYTAPQLEIFFPEEYIKYTFVTKGRRFGATHGAAEHFVERMSSGEGPFLWGDTIHANIDKYFDRYFKPCLKRNNISYNFNKTTKQLIINGQFLDFRSADNPENWEGFGYKVIFLNEAGIILSSNYLYTNAILPMLLDYPDSTLIAAGVPKGKKKKNGKEHMFYTLCKRALSGAKNYRILRYTSYDNPLLKAEDIKQLEGEMSILDPQMVDQEVNGLFIDAQVENPFASQYDKIKHVADAKYNPKYPVHFSIDFNYDPFGLVVFQMYDDAKGSHCYIIDEFGISGGTIRKMADAIREKYGRTIHQSTFTGDYGGTHKKIGLTDNRSLFEELKIELGLSMSQFKLIANPKHKTSRSDCNYFLLHHPDFKIDPICSGLIRDLQVVQVDAFGGIVKRNRSDSSQLADHLDCFRYIVNTHYRDWIKRIKAMQSNKRS